MPNNYCGARTLTKYVQAPTWDQLANLPVAPDGAKRNRIKALDSPQTLTLRNPASLPGFRELQNSIERPENWCSVFVGVSKRARMSRSAIHPKSFQQQGAVEHRVDELNCFVLEADGGGLGGPGLVKPDRRSGTRNTQKRIGFEHVYLVSHVGDLADLCPIRALHNLRRVVPASPKGPLFSWPDSKGDIRPMVKDRALDRINVFGHSFRIGGASYYLAQKVSPEIIRLAGCWKSLAYEAYLRALELYPCCAGERRVAVQFKRGKS
ncbi:hypothetical protein DFH08DRAFT_822871 [Mycena albidolilacea]|uniref:Uncharacterized protein n=1 Tax=Mycena albidolilacea TaxID=1033008 RepID=A0AAD6Z838_9AGAR|nr:hypothetical protein DFH08DRAFT_822871 [Mycena albidolilacea]